MKIKQILKKMGNEKFFIRIACLIVSVALWVMVMIDMDPELEKTFSNVPVTVRNLSALENSNMALMNSDKDNLTVSIKVKGYGSQLNNISKSDFSAYIDVLGFSEGISNANVVVLGPNGIEIETYYPSQITCKVDSVISKVMDVSLNYEGTEKENYFRADGTVNPTSVKITGPRSVVDSAKSAIATVNVDGASSDVLKKVPVRIYDGTNNEIFMSVPVDNVEVSVPIYPTKYVNIKPNITGIPLEGYDVTNVNVNPSKVKIAAPKEILDKITELELENLDVTSANNNVTSAKRILNTEGLFITDLKTEPIVTATVEKTIQKDITYNFDDIEFSNLKEGYEVVNVNKTNMIKATIVGSESIIAGFSKGDLVITADMSNAVPGVNQVILKSKAEKSINSVFLNLNTISVEVSDTKQESSQTQQP